MRDLRELNINEGGRPVTRPPPSDELIGRFERHFQIVLPPAYLDLLRFANGGHPEMDTIAPIGRPGVSEWAVNHFYHLDHDVESSSNLWGQSARWREILGSSLIPFAADSGGNPFVLDLSFPTSPVRGCLHDESFKIVDLAPSFECFIDALKMNPDYI
jgi:hypothetical protein